MAKVYFKNLDGLRFIAATTVALSHIETIKSYRNLPFLKNRFVENSAQLSVTFFFVLSGFLIMWWFLEETKGEVRKINIKAFYINRFSRTWPLYFFIVLISFIINLINGSFFNDPFSVDRYKMYLFFMPNLADLLYRADVHLGQTWSLAVEEFFYLLFPLYLKCISKKKHLLKVTIVIMLFLLTVSTFLNPVFLSIIHVNKQISEPVEYLIVFLERYRLYSFLSGSLAAITLYSGKFSSFNITGKSLNILLIATGILVSYLFVFGITFSFLTHQVYSILFAALIFLFAYTGYSSYILNTKFFITSGKISYGIYMLHMFVVMRLVNQGAFLFAYSNKAISICISWLLLLSFTWLVAYISFEYFEKPVRSRIRAYFYGNGEKRRVTV